jgi:S-(hydroxymethyl)glutathione dehydrogenase/alcohol dehydrogenase
VLWTQGKPLSLENLTLADPEDTEVLIRTRACGACKSDLSAIDGKLAYPAPIVMGHEVTGEVLAKGSKVTHVDVGDRVVGAFIIPCGWCPN